MLSIAVANIYIYIVVETRKFSEKEVLNIVGVELKQLILHLLPCVVMIIVVIYVCETQFVTVCLCGSKCYFNYVCIYL